MNIVREAKVDFTGRFAVPPCRFQPIVRIATPAETIGHNPFEYLRERKVSFELASVFSCADDELPRALDRSFKYLHNTVYGSLMEKLNRVQYHLYSGRIEQARNLIDELETEYGYSHPTIA